MHAMRELVADRPVYDLDARISHPAITDSTADLPSARRPIKAVMALYSGFTCRKIQLSGTYEDPFEDQ